MYDMKVTDSTEVNSAASATKCESPENTHFDFTSKVFRLPGARFLLSAKATGNDNQKMMFAVPLGNSEGLISINSLCTVFSIAQGSSDFSLLSLVERALRVVPDVRPGDKIPSEIIDGTSSWKVSDTHRAIAREKLQARLLSCMTGSDADYTDKAGLKALMEATETKILLRDAFKNAASRLGLSEPVEVVDRIEMLARELSYIEAIREICESVSSLILSLKPFFRFYSSDQKLSSALMRCRNLGDEAIRELFTPLALVDIKFSDMLGTLKSIDTIINEVRQARDQLRFLLMDWFPILEMWKSLPQRRSREAEKAIDALYRLLAIRFNSARSLITVIRTDSASRSEAHG